MTVTVGANSLSQSDQGSTPGVWIPVCARGDQVWMKTSKLISSFPQGWNIKDRRREPHDLQRCASCIAQNGLRGFIPPSRYFLSILSNRLKPYASSHYPEDMLWQPKMVNCKSKKWHEQISRFLTCGGGWKGPLFRSVLPEDTTINSCSIRQPWKSVWANFWLLCWMRKTNTGITSKQEHKVC